MIFAEKSFSIQKKNLKGNNDLLSLTRPEVIKGIHRAYFDAGSDLVETNTFSATSIAMADYNLEEVVHELNVASAKLAREAADDAMRKDPSKPRFVAGAIGPTNRTASLSPDVNDPSLRNVTFDQLVKAYYQQIVGLVEGGVDILMPETTFDTLNLKAAIFAIENFFQDTGNRLPVILSITITDASGRTLSGQTTEACWNSIAHAKPLGVGLNCALGADAMRPYLQALSKNADCFVHCYPNAGLPNPLAPTGYDEKPEDTANSLFTFAENTNSKSEPSLGDLPSRDAFLMPSKASTETLISERSSKLSPVASTSSFSSGSMLFGSERFWETSGYFSDSIL